MKVVECFACGMVAEANRELGDHDGSRSIVLVRPDPDSSVHPDDEQE